MTVYRIPYFSRIRGALNALRGKVSTHPELAGRVHLYSQYAGEVSSAADDVTDYATVYGVYAWVHKAVSKTAEQIAPKKVRVVDGEGEAIDSHPVTLLFEHINDTQSPADFWETYVVNMLLHGESPCELVDNGRQVPVEIWDRPPNKTHIIPDASRPMFPSVAGYRFGDDDTTIPPESVWFDKFYDPKNRWRGLAPIRAVREGITIDLFAQAWSKSFLQSGARPDYAVIAPQGITKSERERYERDLIRNHSGPDSWHQPIVLEQGITDIKPLNLPPKDVEWLEQRKFSRDEIAAVFGMPDEIAGFGRDTYENFSTAWRVWWLLTLKPLVDHRDNALNTFFTKYRPLLKPGETIKTDLSDVGALQEDITDKIDNAEKLFRMGVPFDIIDERLGLGIGEYQGSEERYVSQAQPTQPQEQNYFEGWQKVALKTVAKGTPPSRVFLNDNISLSDSYTLATVLGHCRTKAEVEAVFSDLDHYLNKQVLDSGDEVQPERIALEDDFTPAMEAYLQAQSGRVFNQAAISGEAPPAEFWRSEQPLMVAMLTPFMANWVEAAISDTAILLQGVGLGLDADVNARAAQWAGQYAADLARGLNSTTRELAKAKIRNWVNSGQSLSALEDDLAKVIAPRWRAELIAQTEVTRAYGQATREIAREEEAVKALVWQTARDERVCPICGPLHGTKAVIGGTFPGGYNAPPAHPRCRCWQSFEV